MSTPLWINETTEMFWTRAGVPEPFPRNLRIPIANSLPLAVVSMPALRLDSVEHWMRNQGVICGIGIDDRRLRACLVARYGQGIIFLDGSDPEDEQRFSLAHELAHFLRDYLAPRRLASERLGEDVLEVLDGDRPPRHDERVHALLARVQIGFHVHLMDRSPDGNIVSDAIEEAERDADRLALELLAPSEEVLEEVRQYSPEQRREALIRSLVNVYGMPATLAAYYALLLVPKPKREGSFVRRLGFTT
ncbi:MAG: ImmA/IrrE family metallo-endopeptidase [Actinobacteria bacterium]|nr:ImmA/IrrE family metallo-endopeptidase [Actinomycetota bacterium]MCA1718274.1 ImmA/IrrE family metallo-endopeptidase [Actinomycetota bacterium]